MSVLGAIFLILRGLLRSRTALPLENLALRSSWRCCGGQPGAAQTAASGPAVLGSPEALYCTDWRSHLILPLDPQKAQALPSVPRFIAGTVHIKGQGTLDLYV